MSKFSLFDKGRGGQAEALSSQLTLGESDGNLLTPKIQSETPESVELCRKDLTCFLPHHPHQLKFRENPLLSNFQNNHISQFPRSQLKTSLLSVFQTHSPSVFEDCRLASCRLPKHLLPFLQHVRWSSRSLDDFLENRLRSEGRTRQNALCWAEG